MNPRPFLITALITALVTALITGSAGTAQAVAPPPVASVAVTSQEQGPGLTWVLAVSWPSTPGADNYRVAITDHDGFNTPGSHYASRNTVQTSATLTTDDLIAGHTYWVVVRAVNGSEDSTPTTQPFTAIALDTTGPTGTYTVDRTVAYLEYVLPENELDETDGEGFARVRITQNSLSDDTTPTAGITRSVLNGDGTPARAWTGTGPIELRYARTGNFSPKVELTDAAGNRTLLVLPGVQVRRDTTAPVVRVRRPQNPTKPASWSRIRGVTTDVGTGVVGTRMVVLLRRPNGFWYLYDFSALKFRKGKKTLKATFASGFIEPAFVKATADGTWQSPVIRGLGKGQLHIEAAAFDKAFNDSYLSVTNQQLP